MPCYHPITARRTPGGTIGFGPGTGVPLHLPCGQCIGCKLERSRQWATRIMHEAKSHDRNCFITLTYSDDGVPPDHSLCLDHLQRFLKRYRRTGTNIRYYACGEYGELNLRPHYHACIFGDNFPDKLSYTTNNSLFLSPTLQKLWPHGQHSIGELTFESAAYVARYCTKKITGKPAAKHYERFVQSTGEIVNVSPEFATMSRRPGIGRDWYDQYNSEVFPLDRVIVRGKKSKPPRYYDTLYEVADPLKYEQVKAKRKLDMDKYLGKTADRTLAEREEYVKLRQLKRGNP